MSHQSNENVSQNPDAAEMLNSLSEMDGDQRKFNYLRSIFIDVKDVDEYIRYLDVDEEIDLTRKQIKTLKGQLEEFKVYLRGYLENTGKRIGRLGEMVKISSAKMGNSELTPEEVDRISHTRRRVAKAMRAAMSPRGAKDKTLMEVTRTVSGAEKEVEEKDFTMKTFKMQYEKLGRELKARCTWVELRNRLFAKNGYYLRLATAMNENVILFGVDKEGNPLFADGDEPVMKGRDYQDTRNRVLYKSGPSGHQGVPEHTGYEMFPYAEPYKKSPEIEMFEAATGKPFISWHGENGELCGIWLESGENPLHAYLANKVSHTDLIGIGKVNPSLRSPALGVRRLLRVKKS